MKTVVHFLLFGLLLQGSPDFTSHGPEAREVEQALGRIYGQGAAVPRFDRRLDAAAASLAREVLDAPAESPLRPFPSDVFQRVVSSAGAFDPAPSAIVLRASTPEALARSMAEHPELRRRRATHFGISILSSRGRAVGVILLSSRRVELSEFPRQARVGARCRIAGHYLKQLRSPELAVTDPTGRVHSLKMRADGGGRFELDLSFRQPGVNTVELIAEGRYGPEVVAIFPVEVMAAGDTSPMPGARRGALPRRTTEPERANVPRAEAQVLEAINALRGQHGLAWLARDERLDALARHHARQMGALGFFGHRSPEEGDVGDRLKAAGIGYRVAAENLAESHSALDAQWLLEQSPGHRRNLLLPAVTRVGIGTAPVPGRPENLYLVEIFVRP